VSGGPQDAFAPPFRFAPADLVAAVSGEVLRPGSEASYSVTTDSRLVTPGRVFVALEGERHDGHAWVVGALGTPGTGAIVARGHAALFGWSPPEGRLVVVVEDTGRALLDLGRAARRTFTGPVVGLTGSVGKTTTKEMIAAILAQRGPGLVTAGNFNNLVGVPLTLLRLAPEHRFAVVEMGMNAFGEIDALARCALPTVRLITRIGAAHLEKLGGIEGVARAKGELFAAAAPGDVLVANADDPMTERLPCPDGVRRVLFGEAEGAEVRLRASRPEGLAGTRAVVDLAGETVDVRIPLPGRHNLSNALAAAAVAHVLGLSGREVQAGLAALHPPEQRMEVRPLPGGATLVDDAYNANETSVAAALETLAGVPGPRIVVLGDMFELGDASEAAHAAVGRKAAESGLDLLVGVGPWTRWTVEAARAAGMSRHAAVHARDHEEAAALVRPRLGPGVTVLVKGSRGMAMENVSSRLEADPGTDQGAADGSRRAATGPGARGETPAAGGE